MKKMVLILTLVAFISSGLIRCEQAQQALDTVDKAKAFKDDIEKKAKDVAEKARGFMPGSTGKSEGEKEKKEGGQGNGKEGKGTDD
jgi:hypothetical protein